MATPAAQLDQLITMTFEKVKPVLSDQITQETPLLAWLNSKDKVTEDGGTEIRRPLMYALNDTVGSYDGYDLIDTTPQGGFGYAVYQWRQFAGSITLSGRERKINAGSAQIISLVDSKINQLRLSFDEMFDTMLFSDGTGNSSKDFLGLQALVADTGTLGGIDSSSETWWQSDVRGDISPVDTAVDLTDDGGVASLNNIYNSLAVNKSKPDLEMTTQANFEAYEALSVTHVRFTETAMADLGFDSVAHKRASVVFDSRCPNPTGSAGGYWYFLNSNHMEFVQHSDCWMDNLGFVRPANQDASSALIIGMGNLIIDNRRAHGLAVRVVVE